MFWCFTAGFDHMVNAYEAAATCVNDTAAAVVSTNAEVVVVCMRPRGNHRRGVFVNLISQMATKSLPRKGKIRLARVAQ